MNKQNRARGEAKRQRGLSERRISAQCCEGLESMQLRQRAAPPSSRRGMCAFLRQQKGGSHELLEVNRQSSQG